MRNGLLKKLRAGAALRVFICVVFLAGELTPYAQETSVKDETTPSQSPPQILSEIKSLVGPYGFVGDFHFKPNTPLVIHIQDAHDVEEAQINIAKILEIVTNYKLIHGRESVCSSSLNEFRSTSHEPRLSAPPQNRLPAGLVEGPGTRYFGGNHALLIGLEGASGAFALEAYRAYPNQEVTRGLAEYFLKQGMIGGPEFMGLTASQAPLLWGVEDEASYEENVSALLNSRRFQPDLEKFVQEAKSLVTQLKEKIDSPALKEFDRHHRSYQSGSEDIGSHIQYLMRFKKAKIPFDRNLRLFARTHELIANLDLKEVEKEHSELVSQLSRALSRPEFKRLVRQSLLHRLGRLSDEDYYRALRNFCRGKGIRIEDFKNISVYTRELMRLSKIGQDDLLSELSQKEEAVLNSLAATPEQKQLRSIEKNLIVLEKLIFHSMSPGDFGYYRKHKSFILKVSDDLKRLSSEPFTNALTHPRTNALLKPFESFCIYALARNRAMAENLIQKMKAEQVPLAYLVTGGFHTPGLTQILHENGISYLVITPKIRNLSGAGHYLDVFFKKRAPLLKMFSAEAALKYPPPLAAGADTPESRFVAAIFHAAHEAMGRTLGRPLTKEEREALAAALPHLDKVRASVGGQAVGHLQRFEMVVDGVNPFFWSFGHGAR